MTEEHHFEYMTLLKLTAEIVIAKIGNSDLSADMLPTLIGKVYAALSGQASDPAALQNQNPVVPVRKSVFPDYIICLEDGKKLKMLKRHLKSTYNLTPEQYCAKWGLPPDYPLVAPNYAKRRSALAREIGLGRSVGAQGSQRRREEE